MGSDIFLSVAPCPQVRASEMPTKLRRFKVCGEWVRVSTTKRHDDLVYGD